MIIYDDTDAWAPALDAALGSTVPGDVRFEVLRAKPEYQEDALGLLLGLVVLFVAATVVL